MADVPKAGAFEYLKTQAVSRLYLDNFANIQSSWVTQGLKVGELALKYGANDMGSLMIEDKRRRRRRNRPSPLVGADSGGYSGCRVYPAPSERVLRTR